MTLAAAIWPRRILLGALGLFALLELQVLRLTFSGPEVLALHGPESTRLGRLCMDWLGAPASPLRLRFASLVALLLVAVAIGQATRSLFGERYGKTAAPIATLFALAAPAFTTSACDARALFALFGLAAAAMGLALQLRAPRTRLFGLLLLAFAGFALGWPVAPVAGLALAVPYRKRSQDARIPALFAALAAAAGAAFHTPLPAGLFTPPGAILPWSQASPLLAALVFLPLALAFFQLRDRRRALFVAFLCAVGALQLAALPGAAASPLLGSAALVMALAVAVTGLPLPGLALSLTSAIAAGLLTFHTLQDRVLVSEWRTESLAEIQRVADEVAREGTDCQVFVLVTKSGRADLTGFAQSLAPPFSSATVAVTVAGGEPALFELLDKQRAEGHLLERALLILGIASPADPSPADPSPAAELPPLAQLAPPRPGWTPATPGARPIPKRNATGDWTFTPPVPAHGAAGLGIELPATGLKAQITLQFGDPLTATSHELSFSTDVPKAKAGSPQNRLELALPADLSLLLGPPLVSIHTEPQGALLGPPTILRTLTRPSILEPAPSQPLDLSRGSQPPTLHVVFDPTLPRPSTFSLHLNVAVPGGQLELTAQGPVPSGLGGDLTLTPTTFGPRQTLPGMPRQSWSSYLATGLAQSLERAGGAGTVTLWITLNGPTTLTTPQQVHSFLATPP